MSSVLLQQQQVSEKRRPVLSCWQFWPVATIHQVAVCPVENISTAWPAIHSALAARGAATQAVCAAAIATVAIETASTFQPVKEAFWLSEDWRAAHLRYYKYYGRGYIQLTWESNYRTYGDALGVDLIADPERAMDPAIGAAIFAEFFVKSGAAAAAERHDWVECRRLVQGGSAGLDRFVRIIRSLGLPA